MMTSAFRGRLSNRSIVRVVGKEALPFLQGLFTNHIFHLECGQSQLGCFLNHQGRVLFDAIVHRSHKSTSDTSVLYVEVEKSVAQLATEHFLEYKLRRKVKIDSLGDKVAVVVSSGAVEGTMEGASSSSSSVTLADENSEVFDDPRSQFVGFPLKRSLVTEEWAPPLTASVSSYHNALISAGIGEGPSVFLKEKSLPFEGNMDMLQGVSFQKGCYLGQELTHRTHVMLVTRKRCVPLVLGNDPRAPILPSIPASQWRKEGTDVSPDAPISLLADNQRVGHVVQIAHNRAIGLLRLRYFDKVTRTLPLTLEDGRPVTASIPSWWNEETVAKIFKNVE